MGSPPIKRQDKKIYHVMKVPLHAPSMLMTIHSYFLHHQQGVRVITLPQAIAGIVKTEYK